MIDDDESIQSDSGGNTISTEQIGQIRTQWTASMVEMLTDGNTDDCILFRNPEEMANLLWKRIFSPFLPSNED